MNEKEYTEGIQVQSKSLKWLDNFWYHYKWHTLITLFFVIVFTVCTFQMCTQKTSDILVMYAGSESLDESERSNITKVFEYLVEGEEYSVDINSYNILSEDEIKDMSAETDANGDPVFVNRAFYNEEYQTYRTYLGTGESSVMILSPWAYEEIAVEALRPVSELTDKVSADALAGEYGVILGKLDIYEKYEALQVLPEDTVICLRRPNSIMGKNSKEKNYAKEEELFCAIVEYINAENIGE